VGASSIRASERQQRKLYEHDGLVGRRKKSQGQDRAIVEARMAIGTGVLIGLVGRTVREAYFCLAAHRVRLSHRDTFNGAHRLESGPRIQVRSIQIYGSVRCPLGASQMPSIEPSSLRICRRKYQHATGPRDGCVNFAPSL
jgi:hypothetical protein